MTRSLAKNNSDRDICEDLILRMFYESYVHKVFYSIFKESILSLYLIFRNYFIYDEGTIA